MANAAYMWEPDYGSGLPEKIGDVQEGVGSQMAIQADVLAQMLMEQSVAPIPGPVVTVTSIFGGGQTIGIVYTDLSGRDREFTFDLS